MRTILPWFTAGPVGSGRTTALAKACRELGGTMLCLNSQHEKYIKRKHKIPTALIFSSGHGLRGPFIADHHTLAGAISTLERKLAESQAEVSRLTRGLKKTQNLLASADEAIRELIIQQTSGS